MDFTTIYILQSPILTEVKKHGTKTMEVTITITHRPLQMALGMI